MGLCSSLFNTNDASEQTLHRRIVPTETQVDEQQERWNKLAEFLVSELREKSGYAIRTWLQGSYKFATQVRPARKGGEFDIDLGIYFLWEGGATDGTYSNKELKSLVQDVLSQYESDDVIEVISPAKKKCSRIRFKDHFHIDIPVYHLDPQRDSRLLATEDGWEDSDPKAIYIWYKGLFDDDKREKVRRHIRHLKCWAGLKFEKGSGYPSSVLLTVLTAEAAALMSDEDLAEDDSALAQLLNHITTRLSKDSIVANPTDSRENLAKDLTDQNLIRFIEQLNKFRDIANEAISSSDTSDSADKWSEVFEHFFPLPSEDNLIESNHSKSLILRPRVSPEVSIHATLRNAPSQQWNGSNSIGPIPRDCEINFTIANANIFPTDATAEWIVRNQGDEAEETNDLGHKAGKGWSVTEHSAYKGTHYMDCVIKHNGTIIGLRRITVIIDGVYLPKPKTKKRPFWKELIGRR